MVDLIQAIILGIVQGITEWLPVSSSGHLVIFQHLFGLSAEIAFDLMLHIATLIVVCAVFRKEIISVLKAIGRWDFKSEEGKLALFIIAGTIPTGLIGYFFREFFTSAFSGLFVVGIALIFTGLLLIQSRFPLKPAKLNYKRSVLIGILQGIAITPGVSRSGATISTALITGVDREKAVRFSFLLFIPAILGAMVFLANDITLTAFANPLPMIAGMVTSIIVGYFSLKVLIKLVINKKFHWFALYCWIIGIILLLL
jgi:undecaprenyl-diphosphatase